MSKRPIVQATIGIVALVLLAWGVTRGLDRIMRPRPSGPAAVTPAAPAAVAHITATLFYGSADGEGLAPVAREIPLADGVVAQGREIIRAQLLPPPAPYLPVIPAGTTLREFYVTDQGDAFVDLSGEVSRAHPGGTNAELLTVYAIVDAVTANLPAIHRVQILIDGKEVDTLAGHVDLRHPLTRDASLVQAEPPTP